MWFFRSGEEPVPPTVATEQKNFKPVEVVVETKEPQPSPIKKRKYITVKVNQQYWTIPEDHLDRSPVFREIGYAWASGTQGKRLTIERDPVLVQAVLSFLQVGRVIVPVGRSYYEIQAELEFFQLRPRPTNPSVAIWTHDRGQVLLTASQSNKLLTASGQFNPALWQKGHGWFLSEEQMGMVPGWRMSPPDSHATFCARDALVQFEDFLKANGWCTVQRIYKNGELVVDMERISNTPQPLKTLKGLFDESEYESNDESDDESAQENDRDSGDV